MKTELAKELGIETGGILEYKLRGDEYAVILSNGSKVFVSADAVDQPQDFEEIHPTTLVKPLPLSLLNLMEDQVLSPIEQETVADDLTVIVGIGKVTAGRLYKAGVNTFAQLVAVDADELNKQIEAGLPIIGEWQKRAAKHL